MFSRTNIYRLLSLLLVISTSPVIAQLDDPTRPPMEEERPVVIKPRLTKPDDLLLSAVLTSGTRHVAIINGKPLVIGERIENSIVTAIGRDQVDLRKERLQYTIYMPSNMLNRQHAGGTEAAQ